MDKQTARSEQRSWSSAPNPRSTVIALVCVVAFVSRAGVNAEQASELHDSSIFEQSQYSITIIICVSAIMFLFIAVYILASCTDCYKSEVSTDFHPATGQSERKWGGAGGYTSVTADNVNDSVMGAGFTGEVVLPGQGSDQALPYTMIPSQIPEAQGFRGYGSAPPEQGLRGYGAGNEGQNAAGYGGAGAGAGPQRLPGAHMNPVNEPEEPPPSYFSATN